jgi:5-methylthioadenosine/S-adenosylhomocysteine deaminase
VRRLIRNACLVIVDETDTIAQGDILIEENRIAAIGQLGDAAADEVIDAQGRIIMPGLIQTHIHLCQTLFRSQADDWDLLDWLQRRILPLEAAHDPDSVYASARLGLAELIRGGTTAIVDMETVHHTASAFHAIQESGIRAIAGKVMMDTGAGVPPALLQPAAVALAESAQLMEDWHGKANGRIRYGLCPRFAVSCTPELLRETARLAQYHELHIHTHASENRDEIALVERERGCRNIRHLDEVGCVHERAVLAHCVHLDDAEIEILRDRGAHVAHCPSSNLKLASGIAPIPRLLAHGVNVTLGADGAACNNNLDGFQEMRLAALIQKPIHGPRSMDARTILRMATRGGAKAMGLADEIGSLEVGKRADLIMVDLSGMHTWPEADVISRLVYAARSTDVCLTMVDGRIVMRDGLLLSLEVDRVRREAVQSIDRLLQRIGAKA